MIYIFKGDDTTFADVTKFITFHIQTLLDLSNWKAEFILGSVTKTINDISNKSFEVILTKEDTSKLLYGQKNGIVKLIDDKGQTKTVTNTIPFVITNEVIENKHEIVALSIPQTTEIELTLEIGQMGEGGTADYNDLFNKPKINAVTLTGNKTLDELGIQPKGNYLTSIPSEYVTDTELNSKGYAKQSDLQVLSEKQTSTDDEVNHLTGEVSDIKLTLPKKLETTNILQGTNITLDKVGNNITINSTATGGTTDYSKLISKPQINNVELVGNKTLTELGIQAKGDYALASQIPTKTSDLNNDSGFISSIPPQYVTNTELEQKGYATSNQLKNKLEASNILQGTNITLEKQGNNITINAIGGQSGTTDYNELLNTPQVNSVELKGNKTLEELGIQAKGNYLTSVPPEYITETELNQKGYATNADLSALDTKITSTDDEVNLLTGELSDIKLALPTKLEASNIIQGNNITLEKVGNNITINAIDRIGANYLWVGKELTLAYKIQMEGISPDKTEAKIFDLSEYLPVENGMYEILIEAEVITNAVTNSYIPLYVETDVLPKNISLVKMRSNANIATDCESTAILPLRKKELLLLTSNNWKGKYSLKLFAYRRIGD